MPRKDAFVEWTRSASAVSVSNLSGGSAMTCTVVPVPLKPANPSAPSATADTILGNNVLPASTPTVTSNAIETRHPRIAQSCA